jgi:hypothetical protein
LTVAELRELILRVARANRAWSYTRIQGALQKLSNEVGPGTVANVWNETGIENRLPTGKRKLLAYRLTLAGTVDPFQSKLPCKSDDRFCSSCSTWIPLHGTDTPCQTGMARSWPPDRPAFIR